MTESNRDYRDIQEVLEPTKEQNYIIQGYALKWEPYLLTTIDGVDYFEQIDRHALDNADMSDVIMQYDHKNSVFARQSNQTLLLKIDDIGLKVTADLSKSEKAKELYNEIKEGLVTKMSWAFTVLEESFDPSTRTRKIDKVKKIYDVSCVSKPANDSSEVSVISARTYINGAIDRQKRIEQARKRKQVELEYLLELSRGDTKHGN